MRKYSDSPSMSVSTTRNSVYVSGSYSEVAMPDIRTTHYSISRLYPVLADHSDVSTCSVASKDWDVSTIYPHSSGDDESGLLPDEEKICSPIKGPCIKHPSALEYVVKWKGLSLEEVQKNLLPLTTHYKIQILLLDEHQKRRIIANEQFVERVSMQIQFRYGKPLRKDLLDGHVLNVLSQHTHEILSDYHSTSRLDKSSCSRRSTVRSTATPRKNLDGETQRLRRGKKYSLY